MKKQLHLAAVFITTVLTSLFLSCKKEAGPDRSPRGAPRLTTESVVDITPVSAFCNAKVLSQGIEPTWYRGIVWSTHPNPSVPNSFYTGISLGDSLNWTFNAVNELGPYGFAIHLKPNTKYWVRAFAINRAGVGYGTELSFTTPELKVGMELFNGHVLQIDSTGRHGLIVSNDLEKAAWFSGQYVKTNAHSTTDGYQNTFDILNIQIYSPTYAAGICFALSGLYYPIWYLPAKDQLNQVYQLASKIPGLANGTYWSSTEQDDKMAWSQDFTTGKQSLTDKATVLSVKAFRTF